MSRNHEASMGLTILSLGMFAASVFFIVHWGDPLGFLFFVAGECFLCVAGLARNGERQQGADTGSGRNRC